MFMVQGLLLQIAGYPKTKKTFLISLPKHVVGTHYKSFSKMFLMSTIPYAFLEKLRQYHIVWWKHNALSRAVHPNICIAEVQMTFSFRVMKSKWFSFGYSQRPLTGQNNIQFIKTWLPVGVESWHLNCEPQFKQLDSMTSSNTYRCQTDCHSDWSKCF